MRSDYEFAIGIGIVVVLIAMWGVLAYYLIRMLK